MYQIQIQQAKNGFIVHVQKQQATITPPSNGLENILGSVMDKFSKMEDSYDSKMAQIRDTPNSGTHVFVKYSDVLAFLKHLEEEIETK